MSTYFSGTFIDSLKKMSQYRKSHVNAFKFGPMETEKFRRFVLVHTAQHLSFLAPLTPGDSGANE